MMGYCIVAGGKPDMAAPVTGIKASDLAVGSVVKLMENGVATEYLVVNQGKPSGSSLYDDSCDGTWLLRKDIKENRQWNSSDVNDYENSTIHVWLNGDFFNSLGSIEKSAIKQVKIPYRKGSGCDTTVTSGKNGISTKIFLLSSKELSFNNEYIPTNEGVELSYFEGCADNDGDEKRVIKLNGTASAYWTRSPYILNKEGFYNHIFFVGNTGRYGGMGGTAETGILPALILPSTAVFDESTMLLKGVA